VRVEEHILIPAGRDQVWDFVWQTERVAACVPGCGAVEIVEPQKSYRAQLTDRIGPYRIEAEMEIEVEEVAAPERIKLRATGRDKRLGATQRVSLEIGLRPVSSNETSLDVAGEVEVLGKVASLGQFAIKRKMNDIMKQFGENIRTAVAAGDGVPHA